MTMPPTCGTDALGLSSIRLCSGMARLKRRAAKIVGQRQVIGRRIVAAERELETVLALGRAVASAGVAADLRDRRHYVADEADVIVGAKAGDGDGDRDRLSGERESQFTFAVGFGTHHSGRRDFDDAGRWLAQIGHAGDIDFFAAGERRGEQQLAIIESILQVDRRGLGLDRDELESGRERFIGGRGRRAD